MRFGRQAGHAQGLARASPRPNETPSHRASTKLHNQLFRRVLSAPILFFQRTPVGDILNAFARDQVRTRPHPIVTTAVPWHQGGGADRSHLAFHTQTAGNARIALARTFEMESCISRAEPVSMQYMFAPALRTRWTRRCPTRCT